MILNKKTVKEARVVIESKRAYWEKKLGVKFDKDGRVAMGTLSTFDISDWIATVAANQSKKFCDCFLIGLDELGIERFPLKSITFDDYKRKRIVVTTTRGRVQEKSIAALLQKAQNVWEREFDIYRPYRNHMKFIRTEDGPGEIDKLNAILRNMEKGNTYLAYDKLLREFQEKQLLISINPLDKLFSSGGNGYSFEDTLTKFNSCWSNRFIKTSDESYDIETAGGFSNPEAQVVLGSHISSGMVMVSNGNTMEIDGMKFHGMLQRSHTWLFDEGMFVENIYPDKYNEKRIAEINGILGSKVKIVNPDRWMKVSVENSDFDQSKWFNDFKAKIRRGRSIYLDRSAVDERDGQIWIGPRFRYYSHGGHFWLPVDEVR